MKRFLINFKKGFTLSELLIVLVVIGVIASITLIPVISRINDKNYEVSRKRILTIIGEAGKLIALEGNINSASSAGDFVENYLSKKIKILHTCASDDLKKCGISEKIKTLGGKKTITTPTQISELGGFNANSFNHGTTGEIISNKSYGFVTINGYSVNLFYNPNCRADINGDDYDAPDYVCFNVVYDINGLRRPNEVGKDIGFITLLYPNEQNRIVAPGLDFSFVYTGSNWANAETACASLGGNYSLADKDEILSLAYNARLIGAGGAQFWSSSSCPSSSYAYVQGFGDGSRLCIAKYRGFYPLCIRRY